MAGLYRIQFVAVQQQMHTQCCFCTLYRATGALSAQSACQAVHSQSCQLHQCADLPRLCSRLHRLLLPCCYCHAEQLGQQPSRSCQAGTCSAQPPPFPLLLDTHLALFPPPMFCSLFSLRFMALVLHAAAEQLKLRIIAPDRPGVGASTFLPSRTVQHYTADLAELCDQLGRLAIP